LKLTGSAVMQVDISMDFLADEWKKEPFEQRSDINAFSM
jgi:hypothetical protein